MLNFFKGLLNPLRDEQDKEPIGYCPMCGGEIYVDNGTEYCDDCLAAMMEEEEEND